MRFLPVGRSRPVPALVCGVVVGVFLAALFEPRVGAWLLDYSPERTQAQTLGIADTNAVALSGSVSLADDPMFPSQVSIHITAILLRSEFVGDSARACVTGLSGRYFITQSSPPGVVLNEHIGSWPAGMQNNLYYEFASDPPQAICRDAQTDSTITVLHPLDWSLSSEQALYGYGADYFSYPNDSIVIGARFAITGERYDSNGRVIGSFSQSPYAGVGLPDAGWSMRSFVLEGGYAVHLYRPWTVRLIAPLALLVFVILLSLMAVMNPLSAMVETAIATLVGTWAVRQAILPGVAPGTTLVDVIFLVLQVLIVAVVLLRFSGAMLLARKTLGSDLPNVSSGQDGGHQIAEQGASDRDVPQRKTRFAPGGMDLAGITVVGSLVIAAGVVLYSAVRRLLRSILGVS